MMDNILLYIVTLISLIASILAWVAKIRWSKEYKEAKEAQIAALLNEKRVIETKAEMYKDVVAQNHLKVLKENYQNLDKEFKELYDKYSLSEETRREITSQLEDFMEPNVPSEEEIEEYEKQYEKHMEEEINSFNKTVSELAIKYRLKKHLTKDEYESYILDMSKFLSFHG